LNKTALTAVLFWHNIFSYSALELKLLTPIKGSLLEKPDCMGGVIYRDQNFCHLWHRAIHLARTTSHQFADMDIPPWTFHSNQLYNPEIELVPGDHAFVSS
jgi:hypothetical protein